MTILAGIMCNYGIILCVQEHWNCVARLLEPPVNDFVVCIVTSSQPQHGLILVSLSACAGSHVIIPS